MDPRLHRAKQLVIDLPQRVRLAYCLMRDPHVPKALKVLLGASMGLYVSPIRRPRRLPLLRELDLITLSLISLNLFIAACPLEYVSEHEQRIVERQSYFDDDLRRGEEVVRQWITKFVGMPRAEDQSPILEEEASS